MTPRSKNVLGLVAFVVVAAAMVCFVSRTGRGHVRAIDAVPADAFLVVTVDMDLLRGSPLGAPLLGGPGEKLLGGTTLASLCGFDPLERMREIALAVPVEDDKEFGIAIRADVTKEELIDCARKVIAARGGGEDHVTIRQSGSFTLVEPDIALSKRYPTLAYREGGPFLIARGPWLGTMIDTTEGNLPSAARESRHLALRRELGETPDGHQRSALLATVLLPKAMRERIKRDMGAEVADKPGEASSSALMAGVLGVDSAGMGISAGDAKEGGETRATIDLHCEDATACAAVGRIVDRTRREWSADAHVRVLGVGPLLDNLTMDTKGTRIEISTHAPADETAKWLERALELRSGRHPPGGPPPATPRPAPSSDEVVRPPGVRDVRDAGDGAP